MGLVGSGSSPDLLESLGLACKTGPVSLASALLLDWGGVGVGTAGLLHCPQLCPALSLMCFLGCGVCGIVCIATFRVLPKRPGYEAQVQGL